jgi:hypothetical protein
MIGQETMMIDSTFDEEDISEYNETEAKKFHYL